MFDFHWKIPLFLIESLFASQRFTLPLFAPKMVERWGNVALRWQWNRTVSNTKHFFTQIGKTKMFGLVCNIPQYLHPTQRWQPEPGMEPSSPHTDTSHCQMEHRLHEMKEICDIVSYSEKVQHVISGKNISGELHKWFSNFLCPKHPSLYKIDVRVHFYLLTQNKIWQITIWLM